VGEGARDHSYEWIKHRISPVDTFANLGRPIPAQSALRREVSLLSALLLQKTVCYGGLLLGGRRGCSQQLQDQADIAPVDFDPPRPANPAQNAPRRERKPSFSPFYTKSRYVMAVCWWGVAKAAASNCRNKTTSPPSSLTRLGRQILPRVHSGERRRRLE
jgi:hypothetical protein